MKRPPKRLQRVQYLAFPFLLMTVWAAIEGQWGAAVAFGVISLVAGLGPWMRKGSIKGSAAKVVEVDASWTLSDDTPEEDPPEQDRLTG